MTKSDTKKLVERPPIIAVMGHIDHGKSTLLDYIRKTNTTLKEAGGITQHVAAYEVKHQKDGTEKRITFLDTPGHEAFVKIRERGADVADIAILVVSAEEGVKAQTLEALKCIKVSKTPYIVAINKIDSGKSDIERTKQNLAEHEIYIEGYGGDVPWVPCSGKTGEGIDALLDMVLLVAEIEELKADPEARAEGVVIEAHLDTKKGTSATLIIKNGTLRKGESIVAGSAFSPVRGMENYAGEQIEEASFSSPIKLIGFNVLPETGSIFHAFKNRKEAEQAAQENVRSPKIKPTTKRSGNEVDDLVYIPVVIKADASGTLEAIFHEIKKIEHEKVKVKVLDSGIGAISEGDIKTSLADEGTKVIGFNTKIDSLAKGAAERSGVEIAVFSIIYKLTEWLEAIIKLKIPKITVHEITGRAKILKVFGKTKDKQIVGGRVETGLISSSGEIKLYRRDQEIGRGRIRELQQQKKRTSEVKKDTEFGALIESKIEIAEGDRIECFTEVEKQS
ncbi:MAG TPA: translation initiation factor IF-2 [Candidatus Paceibacterota bacterium]